MKLLDILLQEKIEWPEGMVWCVQDDDGGIKFSSDKQFRPKYNDDSGIWSRGPIGGNETTVRGYPVSEYYKTTIITWEVYSLAKDAYDNRIQQGAEEEKDSSDKDSWFEKGMFPPAGCECEFCNSDDEWRDWLRSVFVGFDSMDNGVVSVFGDDSGLLWISNNPSDFRPIRSEREKAIEDINSLVGDIEKYPTWRDAIAAIVDAGYHK